MRGDTRTMIPYVQEKNIVMKTFITTLLLLLCLNSMAQNQLPDFSFEQVKMSNITMPYRKATIAPVQGEKPAVVIYLHGGSSKGNDNTTQMNELGIELIANYLQSNHINALFLVPQCPKDKSWMGPMYPVLKSMIERYTTDNGALPATADINKVYIFGGSMGGTGTWGMLSMYPDMFAAAMPVAGNPSQCVAENVAHTPVFTVMGTADVIMSVETAADFIAKLNALGDETQMETEEGWSHEDTCTKSYVPRRLDWVFSHIRNEETGIENPTADTYVTATTFYAIDGQRIATPSTHGIFIKVEKLSDGTTRASKISY